MKKSLLFVFSFLSLFGCKKEEEKENNVEEKINITSDSNVLVTYFSVTNNTKKLANYAKEHLSCETFEIVPEQAYTSQDINYNNSDCRANKEQQDDSARPAIKNKLDDLSKFDTIILGFPIWWGQAPKIMYTFIESYNFEGKTILPFCTSGSSPIRSSATNLSKSAPKANWLEGKRFASSTSKEEIGKWLDDIIEVKKEMKLLIDEKEISVNWENNESVKALKQITPLEIKMNKYGGFEQVGPIGKTIASNDVNYTSNPGDIVLYSSNQIVIFYGSNTWQYTKLGHLDLEQNEIKSLLDKPNVTLKIE